MPNVYIIELHALQLGYTTNNYAYDYFFLQSLVELQTSAHVHKSTIVYPMRPIFAQHHHRPDHFNRLLGPRSDQRYLKDLRLDSS
jgi:hypothetical protein